MEEELMLPAEGPESLTAMSGALMPLNVELVSQAAAGDHAAFTALFYQTYRYAFTLVAALLSSDEEIRDVLQEVYMRVYAGLPRLREPAAFLGWLKTIACNCAITQRAKNQTDPLSTALYMDGEEDAFLAEEIPRESALDIRAVLESLPEEQARLLVLVYYDGLKLAEIARMQGLPASTVRSRFAAAKRALQKALKGRGIDRTMYGRGGFFSAVATALRDAIGTDVLSAVVAQEILESVLEDQKATPLGHVAAKLSRRRRNAAVLRIAAFVVLLSLAASAVMVAVMLRRDLVPMAQPTQPATTSKTTNTTTSSAGEAVVPPFATTTTTETEGPEGTTPTAVPPFHSTAGPEGPAPTSPTPGSATADAAESTTESTLLTAGTTTTTTLSEGAQTTHTTRVFPPITKRTTTNTKPTTTHTTKTITTGTAKPVSTTARPTTTTRRTTTTAPTTTTTTAPIVVPEVFVPDYREGYANVLGNNTVNLSYFEASFIAEQDGWLYFFTESNRLMKQNMETGHTTPIYQAPTGDSIRALNAVGDWLYFVNENKGIMRMRTDGSGLEQLSSLSVGWMLVRGEELFYRHNSNLYVMDIPTRKASVVEHSVSSVYVCEKVVYYDKRVSASDFDLYQWTKEKGSELVSANAYYFLANGDTTVYYRTSKGLVARGQDGQERLYPWKQLEVLNGSIWEYGDRLVALERPGEIQQMSLSDGVFSNIVYIAQYSNVQPSYAAGLESGLYWRQDGVVYRCRRGALSFHNYEVFWRS